MTFGKVHILLDKGRWDWMMPASGTVHVTSRQVRLASQWCWRRNRMEGRR